MNRTSAGEVISLPAGVYYRRMWRVPLSMLLLVALVAFAVAFAPMSTSDRAAAPWALAGSSVPFLLALLVPLYYRPTRTLAFDAKGVRLLRGSRLQRVLPWNEVTSIALGPRALTLGLVGTFRGFQLEVRGQGPRDRISVFDAYFQVPGGSLAAFSRSLVESAHGRPIKVQSRQATDWGYNSPYARR